jgi:endoglucanase
MRTTIASSASVRRACLYSLFALPGCGAGSGSYCDNNNSPNCMGTGGTVAAGGGVASTCDTSETGGVTSVSSTVLRVEDNQIKDQNDETIILHGINRSGTEYQCAQVSNYFFDGPCNDESVAAIASWNVNAVRIPLNEQCWLGINGLPVGSNAGLTSARGYITTIQRYVNLLHNHNIIPIIELHWAAPGTTLANLQLPMPDLDHAPAFWQDVATTFMDDRGVILELFNEPFPDGNKDTDAAWACWRDGCDVGSPAYAAAGMQDLVDSVRATGAKNVILLGGVQYSNTLSQWSAHKPNDPTGNLGAAWHIYNFNPCDKTSCFDQVPLTLAATTPVVITEFGENDCGGSIVSEWMNWFDSHTLGYLAWSWNLYGGTCQAAAGSDKGHPWPLISDYYAATPVPAFGQTVHDHFVGLINGRADGG